MTDTRGTEQETKAAQVELFRLAERDYGLSIATLAKETGLSESALKSYNHSNIFARAKMPLWVFVRLCTVIPDDVTSIIVEAAGKAIVSLDGGGDLDALATEASEYTHEYSKARNPAGPGGVEIVPQEKATLDDIRRRMTARAA